MPSNTPLFGLPYPLTSDSPNGAAQIEALATALDNLLGPVPVAQTASFDAVSGGLYHVTLSGSQIDAVLPDPTAGVGQRVQFKALGATGAAPLLLDSPRNYIKGPGVASGATTILLASDGAFVELVSGPDGSWHIEGGQQDTGLIAASMAAGWSGLYYRLIGNRVQCEGNGNAGTSGVTAFTFPAIYRPTSTRGFYGAWGAENPSESSLVTVDNTGELVITYASVTNPFYFDSLSWLVD